MSNAQVFKRITERLRKTDDQFAEAFADEFEKRVKNRTPVDTGTLQRGWETTVSPDEITIRNDVEYAGYVEDGTEHMDGAHMLKVTMSEIPEISKIAQRKIK
jgi:hypothetical protein